MIKKINTSSIGDNKHSFTEKNIPALIFYKCKEGGSHYSMVIIGNLAIQGSKILMFTGYPQAKEQFYTQTKKISKNIVVINDLEDIIENKDKQVIVIHNDDQKLCLTAIKKLNDIEDRIIFIKNIEICHKLLLKECLKHKKIILSGDIDGCSSKNIICKKDYSSVILFSQPKIKLPYKFIQQEKFIGYIRSKNKRGYINNI